MDRSQLHEYTRVARLYPGSDNRDLIHIYVACTQGDITFLEYHHDFLLSNVNRSLTEEQLQTVGDDWGVKTKYEVNLFSRIMQGSIVDVLSAGIVSYQVQVVKHLMGKCLAKPTPLTMMLLITACMQGDGDLFDYVVDTCPAIVKLEFQHPHVHSGMNASDIILHAMMKGRHSKIPGMANLSRVMSRLTKVLGKGDDAYPSKNMPVKYIFTWAMSPDILDCLLSSLTSHTRRMVLADMTYHPEVWEMRSLAQNVPLRYAFNHDRFDYARVLLNHGAVVDCDYDGIAGSPTWSGLTVDVLDCDTFWRTPMESMRMAFLGLCVRSNAPFWLHEVTFDTTCNMSSPVYFKLVMALGCDIVVEDELGMRVQPGTYDTGYSRETGTREHTGTYDTGYCRASHDREIAAMIRRPMRLMTAARLVVRRTMYIRCKASRNNPAGFELTCRESLGLPLILQDFMLFHEAFDLETFAKYVEY